MSSKAYWHSVGSGALGLAGPWNTPAKRDQRPAVVAQKLARKAILATLLLALVTGMAIGAYQNLRWGGAGAQETGVFAYRSVGQTLDQSLASLMMAMSLGRHTSLVHDNILFYLEVPYQLSAFAGAWVATAGMDFMEVTLAVAGGRR
jgi:hypothetical protein